MQRVETDVRKQESAEKGRANMQRSGVDMGAVRQPQEQGQVAQGPGQGGQPGQDPLLDWLPGAPQTPVRARHGVQWGRQSLAI